MNILHGRIVSLNGIRVDLPAERLRDRQGAEVPLRAQSFAVLRHLVANAGRIVSKDELNRAVWRGTAVTDDSLVQCVRDIRRALGDARQEIVRTVPRRGYRLDAPEAAGPPAEASGPVVAVLPFEGHGIDSALVYLGRGVADDIIAILACAPDIAVVSALASFPFSSAPGDLRAASAALGADYLLAGGLRREGDRLRLTARLIDAATGRHLWAERFDRSGADALAVQDEIAGRVVGALTGERGPIVRAQYGAAWDKDTERLDEYDHFLRGHDYFVRLDGRDSNDRAGAIWRAGLAKYPGSPRLRVMLGWHHSLAAGLLWSDDPRADVAAAGRLVRSVLAADSPSPLVAQHAQWLFARVLMQEHEPERALAEARRALDLAPYDAFMRSALAQMLAEGGETRQSRQWLGEAERAAPALAWMHHQTRGNLLRLAGDWAGSVRHYDRSGPLPVYHQLVRAISLQRLGQVEAARVAVAAVRTEAPNLTLAMWRAGTRLVDAALLDAETADLAAAGLPA